MGAPEKIRSMRKRLPKGCEVLKSYYRDTIIFWRLCGETTSQIEDRLGRMGKEHRIPAHVLQRNLREIKADLTLQGELAEERGGELELDQRRILENQIRTQEGRIDLLVRGEQERRQRVGFERYMDKRVKGELEVLVRMINMLNLMMEEGRSEVEEEIEEAVLTPEGRSKLREMLLSGDLKLGEDFVGPTKH